MNREQADSLIRQLGTAIGMTELALDDAGMCLLALEDDTVITIGYDITSEQLILMSPLDAVEPTERVLRNMLIANFLWHGTEGATLALNPSGQVALLQRAVPDAIDVPGLQAAFEAFASQARTWNLALTEQTAVEIPSAGIEPAMMRV